jgi:DNA invertase Pin-like site-specific DNA recombinase
VIIVAHGFDWDSVSTLTPYALLEAKRAIEESERRLVVFREPGSFEHYMRERAIARERASDRKQARSIACWRTPAKRAFAQAQATKLHEQAKFVYRGKFTADERGTCREMYLAGVPFRLISQKLGMSPRTISLFCRGLNRSRRAKVTPELIERMRELSRQGLSTHRIARLVGCSAMVVSRRLRGLA